MFALWTAVTLWRPLVRAYCERAADDLLRARNGDRLDREAGFLAAGADLPSRRDLVDVLQQADGLRLAPLELDARVQVLGVLADDDQVQGDVGVVGADAGVVFAGPDAGKEPQFVPQLDVDAAKPLAHRRGDGGLQGAARAADALQHADRQRGAEAFHHVQSRLLDVPTDLHAGGIHTLSGGRGQFRSHPVPGYQRHFVRHCGPSARN